MFHVKRKWLTDRGLWLETGEATLSVMRAVERSACDEVEGFIPGDGSLLVIIRAGELPSRHLFDAIDRFVPSPGEIASGVRSHQIRVRYGGDAGPDLSEIAETSGLTVDQAVDLHASVEYRVAFIGFQPGFAYMKGTPEQLQVARKSLPRSRVPAGSVALGGGYTGIYPVESAGGWQLIGHAENWLFDPWRSPPAYFAPGDIIRFIPEK